MYEKERYPLELALEIAKRVREVLDPNITEYLLVGSAGRSEPLVGDIDILVRPRRNTYSYVISTIENDMREIGKWHKGGSRQMSVRNVFGSSLNLDLFLCHPPAQWGVLVGVRLNPAEFVIWAKARLDSLGYKRDHGTIYHPLGDEIPVKTEEDYFRLLRVDWVPPEHRRELCRTLGLKPHKKTGLNIQSKGETI